METKNGQLDYTTNLFIENFEISNSQKKVTCIYLDTFEIK